MITTWCSSSTAPGRRSRTRSGGKSAGQGSEVGVDGGKRVKGRKRPIAVDSVGLLLAVGVTAANVDDARAASRVLAGLPASVRDGYADSKYHNDRLYGYTGGREGGV